MFFESITIPSEMPSTCEGQQSSTASSSAAVNAEVRSSSAGQYTNEISDLIRRAWDAQTTQEGREAVEWLNARLNSEV